MKASTKREGATVIRGESGPRGDELANTVYVMPEHQWAPVCLMVDQFDMENPGSRHALAPLGRRQALVVAWALVKAAIFGKQDTSLSSEAADQPKGEGR